jgi:penicillin-binding protein-related factor A (putative recombinase)
VAIQGGKAFFLIHSEFFKKTWLLWIDQFFSFTGETKRKSVPFAWLDANCEIVPKGHGIVLDYLPLVLKRKEAET